MHSDQQDQDWLEGLTTKGASSSEGQRAGAAFRKRHQARLESVPPSIEEFQRLAARIERESGLNTPRPTWLTFLNKRMTPTPGHRPASGSEDKSSSTFAAETPPHLKKARNLFTSPWAIPIAALALTVIWMVKPPPQISLPGNSEDLTVYRGREIANPTRVYTDLPLAGHQFQIVPDLLKAESEWKAALIEAGVSFEAIRSKSLPDSVEIHIRLASNIDHLEPTFALPKAPHHGEWIVYLMPEQR